MNIKKEYGKRAIDRGVCVCVCEIQSERKRGKREQWSMLS